MTPEYLKTQLWYNPETGIFYWLVSKRGPVKMLDIAGSMNNYGYWRIKIDQIAYLAHRLAWFYMHHEWPGEDEIDHIDGDPLNNRIDNLRRCTRAQNSMNVKSLGASYDKKKHKWMARIGVNYKTIYLGRFESREEAVAVARAARDDYFGQFARKQL